MIPKLRNWIKWLSLNLRRNKELEGNKCSVIWIVNINCQMTKLSLILKIKSITKLITIGAQTSEGFLRMENHFKFCLWLIKSSFISVWLITNYLLHWFMMLSTFKPKVDLLKWISNLLNKTSKQFCLRITLWTCKT